MADNLNSDFIHPDEGTLHAWLDGALATDEASAVRTHIAECAACAAAAAEARGLIAASTRILSALDEVPGEVVSGGAISRPRSAWSARRYGPVAAVLAFAAIGTLMLRHNSQPAYGNVGERPSTTTVAQAPQARLDTSAAAHPAFHSQVPDSFVGIRTRAQAKRIVRDNVVSAAPDSSQRSDVPSRESGVVAGTSNVTTMEARAARTFAAAPAAAASDVADSVAVTGRVTATETGLPLPNASVFIAGLSRAATTDSAGFFSIGNVPPGPHTIIARRIGYTGVRQDLNTVAGRPVSLALALSGAASRLEDVVTADAMTKKQGEFPNPPPTIVGTRQISSDVSTEDGRRVRRTVYSVGAGAQITLTETSPRRLDANESQRLRAPSLALRSTQKSATEVHSIEWVAPDGTTLVLSGALSDSELEAFKARVVR